MGVVERRTYKKHTVVVRERVLDAWCRGEDYQNAARHNGVPHTMARRIVSSGRASVLERGDARASLKKCTLEIVDTYAPYTENNFTHTLQRIKEILWMDQ